MERAHLFDLMNELKLYGMKAAFDEVMATAVKRQHEPQRIIGDLLNAEISEKQARSIKYQLTIAKLPLAKAPLRLCRLGIVLSKGGGDEGGDDAATSMMIEVLLRGCLLRRDAWLSLPSNPNWLGPRAAVHH